MLYFEVGPLYIAHVHDIKSNLIRIVFMIALKTRISHDIVVIYFVNLISKCSRLTTSTYRSSPSFVIKIQNLHNIDALYNYAEQSKCRAKHRNITTG